MEFDLISRNAKWNLEQKKRREQAKRKAEMEKRKRTAATKALEELETLQKQKRIERIAELERQEELRLEEQRLTGGITYSQQLKPVPTTNEGDKITLPVSTLEQLNPQNALELGVFTFELSFDEQSNDDMVSIKRQTHAGVLEFTAEEGTVGLPPKVAASLFISTTQLPNTIRVRFVRLEKGKFASLQPRGNGFGERQIDFKHILERSLKTHTTLTKGDVLFVRHGRETFEVLVAELKPEQAVNILNTDLEVDLIPCEAVEKKKEADLRRKEEEARELALEHEKEQWKMNKMASLALEPAPDAMCHVKMVLRMPDGQHTRRFLHSSQLESVFEFVEALTGDEARHFQLVATYPRRVFGFESVKKSLQELGLNTRQETLFVERVVESVPDIDEIEESDGETPDDCNELPDAWKVARQILEKRLDESMNSTISPAIHAMEPIMPVAQSADQEMKWQAQLNELDEMGFSNRSLNIEILERYQGRLLRVVNFLSEMGAAFDSSNGATVEY